VNDPSSSQGVVRLPARLTWPKPQRIPAHARAHTAPERAPATAWQPLPLRHHADARTPARHPAAAWQPRIVTAPADRPTQADTIPPWRVADQRRHQRRSRQRLVAVAVTAVAAMVVSFSQHRAEMIEQLSSDLYAEREQIATMSDSIAVIRAALDSRIERFVSLQARPRDSITLPISGRVSSTFAAQRLHPVLRVWRAHRGVDIPAPIGTPVRPLVAGRVRHVSRDFGLGLFIEVDHGKGIRTRYAHLQSAAVAKGDQVTPETILGAVGTSGLSTAPHLHYEILQHERWVDPLAVAMTIVEIVPGAISRIAAQAFGVPDSMADAVADARHDAPPRKREPAATRLARSGCAAFPASCGPQSAAGASYEFQ
jgi:murein DD-endopeptidase MepM/ murein hydrolase activator NlpD